MTSGCRATLVAACILCGCAEAPPAPPFPLTAAESALFKDGRTFVGQVVTVRGRFQIDAHGPDLMSPDGTACLNLAFRDPDEFRHLVDLNREDVAVVGTVYLMSSGDAWTFGQCQDAGLRVDEMKRR